MGMPKLRHWQPTLIQISENEQKGAKDSEKESKQVTQVSQRNRATLHNNNKNALHSPNERKGAKMS